MSSETCNRGHLVRFDILLISFLPRVKRSMIISNKNCS